MQEDVSEILAKVGDARAFDSLVKALTSGDWIVRMHAAKALGRIADPRAVPSLVPLLQDKVKAVREEAAGALAAVGTASIPSLVQALSHTEWLVRLHAVEALGKLKSGEAVEPLLFALFNDHDSAVREDIVRALGEIGHAQAVDYLFRIVKEPGLRPVVVEALGKIKGEPEIRAHVRAGFEDLTDRVAALAGVTRAQTWDFFAYGMLLNVTAAIDFPREAWE